MAENGSLNRRQRKFVAALLTASTIKEAAEIAGIGETTAHRYLNDPVIKAELRKRQDQAISVATARLAAMSSQALEALEEALSRLREHADGSVADFIEVHEDGTWSLELVKAEEAGQLHLVKKLWADQAGNDRLELHDSQAAAARMGRIALDILTERRRAAELEDLTERITRLEEGAGSDWRR